MTQTKKLRRISFQGMYPFGSIHLNEADYLFFDKVALDRLQAEAWLSSHCQRLISAMHVLCRGKHLANVVQI